VNGAEESGPGLVVKDDDDARRRQQRGITLTFAPEKQRRVLKPSDKSTNYTRNHEMIIASTK
jgi:hypothetical protein